MQKTETDEFGDQQKNTNIPTYLKTGYINVLFLNGSIQYLKLLQIIQRSKHMVS